METIREIRDLLNWELLIFMVMTINRNVFSIAIIGAAVLAMILYVAYNNFPLFQRKDIPMAQIHHDGATIDIKLVQSGAITQDVVQVTMKKGNADERVISNIAKMNFLIGYQIIDDTLALTLKDTVLASNRPHIFKVLLPK